jgi:hypothetical protein
MGYVVRRGYRRNSLVFNCLRPHTLGFSYTL